MGVYDFEFSNPKATRVYVVTLRADLPSPFAPKSDEAGKKPEKSADREEGGEERREEGEESVEESQEFPHRPGGHRESRRGRAHAARQHATHCKRARWRLITPPRPSAAFPDRCRVRSRHPRVRPERTQRQRVTAGATTFTLSFDGPKLLYIAGSAEAEGMAKPVPQTYGIIDAKPSGSPHKVGDGALNLVSMRNAVDPRPSGNRCSTKRGGRSVTSSSNLR